MVCDDAICVLHSPHHFPKNNGFCLSRYPLEQLLCVHVHGIVIMGQMFRQHLVNFRLVLDRLRGARLMFKPTKCSLCHKDVLFLGHRITWDGIATDQKWAVPQMSQKLLGFLGNYRKYTSDFVGITKPLYRLTEKRCEFKWTSECGAAFEIILKNISYVPFCCNDPTCNTWIVQVLTLVTRIV